MQASLQECPAVHHIIPFRNDLEPLRSKRKQQGKKYDRKHSHVTFVFVASPARLVGESLNVKRTQTGKEAGMPLSSAAAMPIA